MALIVSFLRDNLLEVFQSPPPTSDACAALWASIMASYASALTPPLLGPPVAAEAALRDSLSSAFNILPGSVPTSGATALAMEAAWRSFSVTLGSFMSPPFASTPVQVPPGLVGFLPLFTVDASTVTHASAASSVASSIHSWMTTGTAINSTSGATVPWS